MVRTLPVRGPRRQPRPALGRSSCGTRASPDQTLSATARRKDERLVVDANGGTQALRLARNTVTDFAAFRLAALLPAVDAYPVELLRLVKPGEPVPARFEPQAEEVLTVDGRALRARRWFLADGGEEDRVYWIDAAGRLVKARAGDIEMRLTTEEKARDVDVK